MSSPCTYYNKFSVHLPNLWCTSCPWTLLRELWWATTWSPADFILEYKVVLVLCTTIIPLLSTFTLCSVTNLSLNDNNHGSLNRGQIWRPWSSRPGWSTTVPLLSSLTPSSASRSKRSRPFSLQWRYVCHLIQWEVTGRKDNVFINWCYTHSRAYINIPLFTSNTNYIIINVETVVHSLLCCRTHCDIWSFIINETSGQETTFGN